MLKTTIFKILYILISQLFNVKNIKININKILIIQLQNLGDSVVFIPALKALRKSFTNSKIDILVGETAKKVYENNTYSNNLIQWKGIKTIYKLKKLHYDCIILDANHIAFRYMLLSFLIYAPLRIGFNWGNRGFLNTVQLHYDNSLNQIDKNLMLIKQLAGKTQLYENGFWINQESEHYIDKFIKEHKINKKNLILIAPCSNRETNLWYNDRFAKIADFIIEKYKYNIVFTGKNGEDNIVNDIIKQMKQKAISSVGISINQLASLITNCKFVITIDSGVSHLTSLLQIPMILIMSAQTIQNIWVPKGGNIKIIRKEIECEGCKLEKCKKHKNKCMDLINVDEVINAIEELHIL